MMKYVIILASFLPVLSYGATYPSPTFNVVTATTVNIGGTVPLLANGNLSDLTNAATARVNLGLGTAATQNTGVSGAAVPLLNGANTWSAAQSMYQLNTSGAINHTGYTPGAMGMDLGNYFYGTSSVSSGDDAFNKIAFSDTVQTANPAGLYGLQVWDSGGTPMTGSRIALEGRVGIGSFSGNAGGYIGIEGDGYVQSSSGGNFGIVSPTSLKGELWGGWFYPRLATGATNWNAIFGTETDMLAQTGTSVGAKIGAGIYEMGGDSVQGTFTDAALNIAADASGLVGIRDLILLGGVGNTFPTNSQSTLIDIQPQRYAYTGAPPMASYLYGIDARASTIAVGGAAWASPFSEIDPNGVTYGNGFTTTGTIQAQSATLTGTTIVDGGAYTTDPTWTVTAPPAGGTTATVTTATMGLSADPGDAVISVATPGAGCTNGDVLTITGGGGASITAIVAGGQLTGGTLKTVGSIAAGSLPTEPVSFTGGTCTSEPTATVGFQVLTLNLTPGAGYPALPLPLIESSPTNYFRAKIVATMTGAPAALNLNPTGGAVQIAGSPVSAANTAGTAIVPLTVGASPYAYTATVHGFVAVSGGTLSAATLTRSGTTIPLGSLDGDFNVSAGDVITVTYSAAPVMNFVPW